MSKTIKLTPMLRQYLEIKEQHQNTILFYRMGDFYEMFFDDAVIASKILGITLTSRNSKNDKNRVPMCGVPYHAAQGYLAKLVKAGQRVAICEQTEDPSQAKGIVKREVIRIVSPGVVTDDQLLDAKDDNYLAAIARKDNGKQSLFGISFLDVSTGKFLCGEFSCKAAEFDVIVDQLARLTPSELIISSQDVGLHTPLINTAKVLLPSLCVTERDDHYFHHSHCLEVLNDHFQTIVLDGFGLSNMKLGITAAGVLLDYIHETQKSSIVHIQKIEKIELDTILLIDDSSRRNLELTQTIVGAHRSGSLLSVLDNCMTPMGSRKLKNHILFPLRSVPRINARLDSVSFFFQHGNLRQELRDLLDAVYDIERLNSRMVVGTANARDMLSLKHSLQKLPAIKSLAEQCTTSKLQDIAERLDILEDITTLLESSIAHDPPVTIKDGNIIKEGYNDTLDELIHILRDGKQLILNLEAKEREATEIPKLKIGFNKVFGYFIEVSKVNQDKVPDHYIRKQTLVNAERFITPELKEFEAKVIGAQDKRLELEYSLFVQIRSLLADASTRLLKLADLIAQLDVLSSLGESAVTNHYRRPTVNDSEILSIVEGRHPVIEQALPSGKFVPNDVHLDQETNEVVIITGPNMAGKSTVLRQTALIVLMAQMGSFVPAESAEIGLVDRIFTRVGAMDDLRRGQSTFMVEMSETANILNNVTTQSLVILDEIGRGTSTFDGLSIAWAVAEELVTKDNHGVKTLFATHYHELTELALSQPKVQNYSIAVREWNNTIIFLHKLIKGGTSRSYGIQVASLAGVPEQVVKRASQILKEIEKGELSHSSPPAVIHKDIEEDPQPSQLSLFQQAGDAVQKFIDTIDVDDLTPRQALELIYELKNIHDQNR